MDWNTTNATDLLHFEKIRTPEIFLQSLELFATAAAATATATATSTSTTATNHSTETTINTYYDSTTFSMTTEFTSSTQINIEEESNHTLRIYPALSLFTGDMDLKYLERINTFWLQFHPPTVKTQLITAIIYIILMITGCCGNAFVIFMFIRCKSLRTPANTLVINLAISDFFMIVKCPIPIYNSLKLGPALGDLGCRVYGFLGGLTGCVSITTLTAIAIDRYNVIVYPLDPLRSTTKLRTRITLLFIWIYSFSFAVIPALNIGLGQYVPEGFLTTCSFDYLSKNDAERIFMFTFFVGAWVLPFITITYCYFYILKVVASANSIQSSKDKNKTEFKLTAIVSGVILLWFSAWTPYAVVALLGISGNERFLTPIASMVPAIFCKISACVNPYVYAVTHPRFRMEFRRVFLGQDVTVKRTSTFRSSTMSVRHNNSSVRMSTRNRAVVQDIPNNQITNIQNNNNNNMQTISESTANLASSVNTLIDHHHNSLSKQLQSIEMGPGLNTAAMSSNIPTTTTITSARIPTALKQHLNTNLSEHEKNICDETSLCT